MANEQTIANLIVRLSAQTVELTQGLNKAEDAVQSFSSGAQKILGGISFVYIAKQFENMVMGIVNAAAEISRAGQHVGMSAAEIGKLSAAAEHVGVSTDTMARGLRFLAKSMTEAQNGNIGLQMTFKELNVQIETLPGVAAKPYAVFLQLADAFAATDDEARKTAIAIQLLGRGGAAMIPFLDEGSKTIEEWVMHAEKMGAVMSSGLASQSRAFQFTLVEIKDAIDGMKIALAEALLPHLQELADDLLVSVEYLNSFKSAIASMIPILRDVGIAIAFLATAKFLTWLTAATGGITLFASAFAALTNPVFAVAAALAVFVIATEHVRDTTEAANRELATFDRSIKRMSLGDLDSEAQKLRISIEDLTEDLVKLSQEQASAIAVATGEDSAAVVAMNNLISAKQAQLKLATDKLNKVMFGQENLQMKLGIGITTDPEAFKALTEKIAQLKTEMISFNDPLAGQVAAFKAWIDQLKLGKTFSAQLNTMVEKATGLFMANLKAQNDLAVTQAKRSGDLKQQIAYYDAYLSELQNAYDLGVVGLESYYEQRMVVIKDRGAAEIAALQASLKDPKLTQAQKIDITAEISVKKTNLAKDIAKETTDATKAVNDATASMREGAFQRLVDLDARELEILKNQFTDGLATIKDFYDRQREIADEEAKTQVVNIEVKQAVTPTGTAAWQDLENQKTHITEQAVTDRIKLNKLEADESRKSVLATIDTATMILNVKAEGAAGELDAMRLRNQVALSENDRRSLIEIAQLSDTLGKKSDLEMSFEAKRQALEDLYAAQDMRRSKLVADQERQVYLQKLQYAQQMAGNISQTFSDLYEASGKKIKAFFYIQKAAAIAEATINGAIAFTNALTIKPATLGIAMAAVIASMTAAQIALITAQTIKGMFRGGPVTGGSGTKDDVPIMATRGEYVQPAPVVRYYGTAFMEAIRRMVVPKDMTRGFGFFPVAAPQFAFASGGAVTERGGGNTINVPVNVESGDKRLASMLRSNIEEVVVKILKEYSRQ